MDLFDLWKIGKFAGFCTTRLLFEKSLVKLVLHENGVWVPQIRFKQKPLAFCPFLTNELDYNGKMKGLCQLQPGHKPLVCSLAPVGRIVDLDLGQQEFVLVPPAEDCPGMDAGKFNRLEDIKNRYSEELELQIRFFRMLNHLKNSGMTEQVFYELLYVFKLKNLFPETLNMIESKVFLI